MRNKIKTIFKVALSVSLLVFAMAFSSSAAEASEQVADYSINQLGAEFEADLKEQGITILGGKDAIIEVPSKEKAVKPYVVNVSWRVGYNATSGLSSHIKAKSTSSKCQLKVLRAYFGYDVRDSGAAGLYDVTTYGGSPLTNMIYSSYDTKKFFPKGTVLDCSAYGDVDALNEITGGEFDFTDIVTIK